jgi:hypothetical protein
MWGTLFSATYELLPLTEFIRHYLGVKIAVNWRVCQYKLAAPDQESKQWIVVIVFIDGKQFTEQNKQD